MKNNKVTEILKRFEKKFPNPKSELHFKTKFELLIAVILSAQATDISVNKATKELFKVANTPAKILTLGEKKLKQYIKSIGLYNTKAKNIIKTCKILIDNFNAKIPNKREDLVKFPGVGRKTANVVLNVAFNQNTIGVDTHIFRISNRIGFTKAKTPLAVEKKLLQIIPTKYLKKAHLWFVLHGRYVCTAKNPKCETCIINDLCKYNKNNK